MILKSSYKTSQHLLFLSILYFVSNFSIAQDASIEGWNFRKFESGIAIYTKNAEGSSLKELKAIMTVKTSLSSIVAVLNDWENYPEWSYRCGESSTLKKISDTEVVHYQSMITPWPVENRDFILRVKLEQNIQTKVITISSTAIPDYIPKKAGHIRIKTIKSTWLLIPLKDGTVEVVYQMLVDPGGSIPAWMINLALVDGPYESCYNLKKRVFLEKYQNAKITYISEVGL